MASPTDAKVTAFLWFTLGMRTKEAEKESGELSRKKIIANNKKYMQM